MTPRANRTRCGFGAAGIVDEDDDAAWELMVRMDSYGGEIRSVR